MKAKNKKYLIIGAILVTLVIIVSVITYVVLTREPEPLTLSIAHYYDKDGNEIKVGKQQAVIGGIEGVRYIDFLVESYNADTVDLDFEITSTSSPDNTLVFTYDVAQPQVITLIPDDTDGWMSELIDVLPYVGTTMDFSVSVTGSAVSLRQPYTETATKSINVESDPFASFSVSIYSPQVPIPGEEGFENGFTYWSNVVGDDFDWLDTTGTTPSSSTGPSSAYAGSYYAYTEASGNNPDRIAYLESEDLTIVSGSEISFYYHMYGISMGTLSLEIIAPISPPPDNVWTEIWSMSGNQGNNWYPQTIDLSSYAGHPVINLRFVGVTGSGITSDMALDKIIVT